ncbi:MAG: glycoside hydrolase family 2 [Chloroflexia bacterium]|nr:glycoside hydrolase family 2 [Chloroflexia bacterium]
MFATDDYPRPLLRRDGATSLDGEWQFALDPEAKWATPAEVVWERRIRVPFAPETPLSGIGETGFLRACWYRRLVDPVDLAERERLLLHFGAVDEVATVWVNGELAGTHAGGYTPFSFDISAAGRAGEPVEIIVRAEDDPRELAKPRGKQDWRRQPHSIWYPRTTGIWQTVWLERLPPVWIESLLWTPDVAGWQIGLEVRTSGHPPDLQLEVHLSVGTGPDQRILARDTYSVIDREVRRVIQLPDPGIDDARKDLLWSPESPILIQARLRLRDGGGAVIDDVRSYIGLRSVAVDGDRFMLNGRPFPLRLVLDQGYWPESGLTAPEPAALRRDIELTLAMGFNGARKHQKIEDPRYLYWADRLGLLVWEELPSAYRFSREAILRLTHTWTEAMRRDLGHPCVVTWVPFNESWGVPDLPLDPAQRDAVRALYRLTKALDPSRPVIDNDGWESVETDLIGIHDYDHDADRLGDRYASQSRDDVLLQERPGHRRLRLAGAVDAGQPWVLSEFGGIAYTPPEERERSWGYDRAESAADFQARYERLLAVVRGLPFAGFCYTQFADTYQEKNGLLYDDRAPKFPLAAIAHATRGPRTPREIELARRRRQAMSDGEPSDPAAARASQDS